MNHLTAIRLVRNRAEKLYKEIQQEDVKIETILYSIDTMITWLEAAKIAIKVRS